MKSGWNTLKLKEVCSVITDGTHKTPKYTEDGVRFISIKNVKPLAPINWDSYVKYISDEEHQELKKRCNPEFGDILFPRIGTLGYAKKIDFKEEVSLFVGLGLAKPKKDIINSSFLEYYLNSPYIYKLSHEKATGSGRQTLALASSREFPVPVPPLEQQKQIVAKLNQCFEAIDAAKANAAKNLENAKELFQSKLNDIFNQKGEGWVEKKLGEISDVTYGFTDKSVEVGDFRYVRITDIDNNGELISTGKKYINSSKDGEKFILKDNDILMARTGATFAKLLLYKDIEPSVFASYLIKIDFTENIDNEFYWFYAKSNGYWDQVNTLSTGSAQPHFNGKALKQVLFPYPISKIEQSRLINEFKRFQSKTQSLESKYQQELNSLEELKKSILQKAFEGEL